MVFRFAEMCDTDAFVAIAVVLNVEEDIAAFTVKAIGDPRTFNKQ